MYVIAFFFVNDMTLGERDIKYIVVCETTLASVHSACAVLLIY